MNKRDYEILAKWLVLHRPNGTEEQCQYWYNMVIDLVDILRARDPKFDSIYFLGECGYHV